MRIRIHRREWLQIVSPITLRSSFFPSPLEGEGLGMRGSTLTAQQVVADAANNLPGFGSAKSVLIVFTPGGMSQFETWDPKPNAPAEIRGQFASIATRVPGIRLGEHMPRTAQQLSQLQLVRSMSHDDTDHGSAMYLALTGQFHSRKSSNPPITPNDFPTMGAVLKRLQLTTKLPQTAIHLNGPVLVPEVFAPGQNGGFLGRKYDPFVIGNVTRLQDSLGALKTNEDLELPRLEGRLGLLQQLNQLQVHPSPQNHGDALELLSSHRYRQAFRLEEEPQNIRESYGKDRAGQACLLARRLVEAGIPVVIAFMNHNIRGQDKSPDTTDEYGWDTHNDVFDSLKQHLLPRFDRTFPTLIQDLSDRGILDSTLVLCMGEFGRAPLVAIEKNFAGSSPGRKHWAACYSIAIAGAGTTKGAVYGKSDRRGAYPSELPVTPADVIATIYHALGIPHEKHFADALGRGYAATTGSPITALWS